MGKNDEKEIGSFSASVIPGLFYWILKRTKV
jgi:hypothetical protein